jgi:hypothetical protein
MASYYHNFIFSSGLESFKQMTKWFPLGLLACSLVWLILCYVMLFGPLYPEIWAKESFDTQVYSWSSNNEYIVFRGSHSYEGKFDYVCTYGCIEFYEATYVYNILTKEAWEIGRYGFNGGSVTLSNDGQKIIYQKDNTLYISDISGERELYLSPAPDQALITHTQFSPGDQALLIILSGNAYPEEYLVISAINGMVIDEPEQLPYWYKAKQSEYSPNGKYMIKTHPHQGFSVIERKTGKTIIKLPADFHEEIYGLPFDTFLQLVGFMSIVCLGLTLPYIWKRRTYKTLGLSL